MGMLPTGSQTRILPVQRLEPYEAPGEATHLDRPPSILSLTLPPEAPARGTDRAQRPARFFLRIANTTPATAIAIAKAVAPRKSAYVGGGGAWPPAEIIDIVP